MKIFIRLNAFYNFMEAAEITKKKKKKDMEIDKKNKTYAHRKWKKVKRVKEFPEKYKKVLILFKTLFPPKNPMFVKTYERK